MNLISYSSNLMNEESNLVLIQILLSFDILTETDEAHSFYREILIPEHMNFIYIFTVMYSLKLSRPWLQFCMVKMLTSRAPRYGMHTQKLITSNFISLLSCIRSVFHFKFSITGSQWYGCLHYMFHSIEGFRNLFGIANEYF